MYIADNDGWGLNFSGIGSRAEANRADESAKNDCYFTKLFHEIIPFRGYKVCVIMQAGQMSLVACRLSDSPRVPIP